MIIGSEKASIISEKISYGVEKGPMKRIGGWLEIRQVNKG
jgi:hypothetical protein